MLSLRLVLSALVAVVLVQADPAAAAAAAAGNAVAPHRYQRWWNSRNQMSKSEFRRFQKYHKSQKGASGCKDGSGSTSGGSDKVIPVPVAKPKPKPSAVSSAPVFAAAPPSSTKRVSSTPPAAPAPSPEPEKEEEKPATQPQTPPASSNIGAEQQAVLQAHNDYRAKHGANPLKWSARLATAAQAWTDRCVYEHGGGKSTGSGENIAMGYPTMADAFVGWGPNEEADYNPAAPTYSHFTQVVWKATTELGCGKTMCSGRAFISCIYNPAGNMYGPNGSTKYFDENVQK